MVQKRSYAFRLTSSVFLSISYFVFAVGIWGVAQNKLGISADIATGVTCAVPAQIGADFGNGSMSTPLSTLASGWKLIHNGVDTSAIAPNAGEEGYTIIGLTAGHAQLQVPAGNTTLKIPTGTRATGSVSFHGAMTGAVQFVLLTAKGEVARMQYVGGPQTIPLTPVSATYTPQGIKVTGPNLIQYQASSGGWTNMPTSAMSITGGLTPQDSFLVTWDATGFSFAGGADVSYTNGGNAGPVTEVDVIPVNIQADPIAGTTKSTITGDAIMTSAQWSIGSSTPCVAYISNNSVNIGDQVTLTGTNFTNSNSLTFTPVSGGTPITNNGWDSNGSSIAFTTPDNLTPGSYNLSVTNANGTSNTVSFTVLAPVVVQSTTTTSPTPTTPAPTPTQTAATVACSTSNITQTTQYFDDFSEGATDIGWQVVAATNTSATVTASAGKSNKGLQLIDNNSTTGYQSFVGTGPTGMGEINSGSVSLDVRPHETTGRFEMDLESDKGTFLYTYLAPDGTFQYWDQEVSGGYVPISSQHYQAGSFMNIKIEWDVTQGTFNFYVDGTKINSSALPFSYRTGDHNWVGPVSAFGINTSAPAAYTGTYDIDNLSYPTCGTTSNTNAEQVLAWGTDITCTTSDSTPATDSFDSFADGATSGYAWQINGASNVSAKIAKGAGKTGNGLELTDNNPVAGGSITAWRTVQPQKNGSLSFDVRANNAHGDMAIQIWSGHKSFIWAYWYADGSVGYWDETATNSSGSHYLKVGNQTFPSATNGTPNWLNLKVEWNEDQHGFNLYANGTKLNSTILPFSYHTDTSLAGPVNWIGIGTRGGETEPASGVYDIDNVIYPGCSAGTTPAPTETVSGTRGNDGKLTCPANPTASVVADNLNDITEGATKNIGYDIANVGAGTSIKATSAAGKDGQGLLMTNSSTDTTSAGVGYANYAEVSHSIYSSDSGTVSFDLRPHQTTGSFAVLLFGPTGGTGTIAEIVFNYDGTVGYLDYSHGGGIKQIGNLTYKANQWQHVSVNWISSGVKVTVDNQTTGVAPYVYTNNTTDNSTRLPPINVFGLIAGYGDGTHPAGAYDIDNIVYPGCTAATVKVTASPLPTITQGQTPPTVTQPLHTNAISTLVATGGNIVINLLVAGLLSLVTTYFFLRRKYNEGALG